MVLATEILVAICVAVAMYSDWDYRPIEAIKICRLLINSNWQFVKLQRKNISITVYDISNETSS